MSHNNENELDFLSIEFKGKLNKISMEMSKYILLSTFRNLEVEWCAADAKAGKSVKILFDLKGRQICHLIKEMFNGGLVLTPAQRTAVLNYLYAQTERIRAGTRLHSCSRNFFKSIFEKYLGRDEQQINRKRPREDNNNARTRAPLKKLKPNETNNPRTTIAVIALGFLPPTFNRPFYPGKMSCNAQYGNAQHGIRQYGNLFYRATARTIIYPKPYSLVEIPRNMAGISAVENKPAPQPSMEKSAEPITLKTCKKEEKKEIKEEMPSTSTSVFPAAVKKEETEPGKPADREAKKKNRNRELFGNFGDDSDSDIEIIGSYTIGVPADKKFVRTIFD